ncbi:MAG TPA: indolepyruvate ferredoxin oxidoreductase family protein, partial [Stellaceae bacterium]|nr:indolepyruvate ferredoxin oxidoreductase family protein [Stellaceae bacterium]
MALAAVSLDDKYTLDTGRIYLTGIQALVRLPIMQRRRDQAMGLNTAGFISGYRGSPVAGLDQNLWHAGRLLAEHHIRFQPGINEDLAATAVWGTQQVGLFPGAKYDGVFAFWYGKGPGVDRTGDAFKHANAMGTAPHGGVLAVAGDDHAAKSSTLAHQSEYAFIDASIPVLNPAGVQDLLDLGLYGWALSRFSGCWVGLKAIADTMDNSASVHVDPDRVQIVLPEDFALPPGGLNIRVPDHNALEIERRLRQWKLPAVIAFARANRLDRVTLDSPQPRLGIVAAGKAYLDLRQALADLGIDEAQAAAIGLRLYKVALTWPLEPEGIRRFAAGLEEILVVEEKRPIVERQLKDILYDMSARPRVVGKTDERGAPLLPETGEFDPALVARAVAARIGRFHSSPRIADRLGYLNALERQFKTAKAPIERIPYFCSGCPHNTSTRLPEGSRATAGIGCHYMAVWMDRETATVTQMGGEGTCWIGQAPFTETPHIFANLGDGTYFHSGILAIRAALAAGVTITYKLLYNDAVAMTGGQPIEGHLTVPQVTRQLAAEGVARIVVVTDEPDKYPSDAGFADGVAIFHREKLDAVQRQLRETAGVSVLVYDQTCAAEKRRRRKRGQFPDPPKRAFINEQVCEGCGDCSRTSNCLSVVPVETEFGRKRAIDQSSCNKDFSCVEGFCPSFVTVHGGRLSKHHAPGDHEEIPPLPEPALPALSEPYDILVAGIGGTGVVTIGALLGMAAHLEGKGCSVLDMTGLAQKGGAVLSHIRIAAAPEAIHAARITAGGARLLLGCDIVVAAAADGLSRLKSGASHAVINQHETVTGAFTQDPDLAFPGRALAQQITGAVGRDSADFIDATRLATALLGDAIATNLFLTGYAYQKGLLPVSAAAIERAIELNAVAAEANRRAFRWGRWAALDRAAVERIAAPTAPAAERLAETLDEIVARRVQFLTRYQNRAYAARYERLVRRAETAERQQAPGTVGFAEAVARNLFKLMAYKDEYEVARLYTDGSFLAALHRQFEGDFTLEFHLAPPLLAERDPVTGHLKKRRYGPSMLRVFAILAKLKFLRGTALDPFGRSAERRTERALIAEYEALIEELIAHLDRDRH